MAQVTKETFKGSISSQEMLRINTAIDKMPLSDFIAKKEDMKIGETKDKDGKTSKYVVLSFVDSNQRSFALKAFGLGPVRKTFFRDDCENIIKFFETNTELRVSAKKVTVPVPGHYRKSDPEQKNLITQLSILVPEGTMDWTAVAIAQLYGVTLQQTTGSTHADGDDLPL